MIIEIPIWLIWVIGIPIGLGIIILAGLGVLFLMVLYSCREGIWK